MSADRLLCSFLAQTQGGSTWGGNPPPTISETPCRVVGHPISEYVRAYRIWSKQRPAETAIDINRDALGREIMKFHYDALVLMEGTILGTGVGYYTDFDPNAIMIAVGAETPGALKSAPGGDGPGLDNAFGALGTPKGKNNFVPAPPERTRIPIPKPGRMPKSKTFR